MKDKLKRRNIGNVIYPNVFRGKAPKKQEEDEDVFSTWPQWKRDIAKSLGFDVRDIP